MFCTVFGSPYCSIACEAFYDFAANVEALVDVSR